MKKLKVSKEIKYILKKININIKFTIGFLLKKHRCILCKSSENLSLVFKGWPYYYLKCNSCDLVFAGNLPSDISYQQLVQNAHL